VGGPEGRPVPSLNDSNLCLAAVVCSLVLSKRSYLWSMIDCIVIVKVVDDNRKE
jgi:hypothetical protein